jgi:hypothetical protein
MTRPAVLMLTADEVRVLTAYGRGVDLTSILEDTSLTRAWVSDTLTRLVGLDRGRAREMAIGYDRQRAAVAATKGPPTPAPTPTATPDRIEALLFAAERSGLARLTAKATRCRALLDELRQGVAESEAERSALAEVTAARQALDSANARLRELRGKPAPVAEGAEVVEPSADPDARTVRAWAAANGVECGPIGRVPRGVVEQYLAASAVTS